MRKMSRQILTAGFTAALALLLSACAGGGSGAASDTSRYDLSHYRAVMIDPVTVKFDKDWVGLGLGTHIRMTPVEMERVRGEVAALFDEAFREELAKGGTLRIVDQPGPGVLRITPELVDVYLNAPLLPERSSSLIYTRHVGSVTLDAAFRDSVSNEALIALNDRVRGEDLGLMRQATPVFSAFELTRIFEDWAQVVRQDIFRAP